MEAMYLPWGDLAGGPPATPQFARRAAGAASASSTGMRPQLLIATGALLCLAGCGPSAPRCPDAGTTLTYENFGAAFMTTYCVDCHGPKKAEKDITLQTAPLVQTHAARSNDAAGVGTSMPPEDAGVFPTSTERAKLAEWLSCGAPSGAGGSF